MNTCLNKILTCGLAQSYIIVSIVMNTCVSESLVWKGGKKTLSLSEQRRFCLGLLGWCPCINCSPLPMASKYPSKRLSLKRKETADQSSLKERLFKDKK